MSTEELIAKAGHLKPPASTVTRLIELLSNIESCNSELLFLLEHDAILSAKILGLCNSAAMGGHCIESLDQAILRLGYQSIYKLVLSLGFGSTLSPKLDGYQFHASALWQHSLLAAIVTSPILERQASLDLNPSIAYTAGLVHDIGKVVLNQVMDEAKLVRIREMLSRDHCALLEAERAVIGSDHAETGAYLLRSWGLPGSIVEAVAHHHSPVLSPKPQLSAVIHLADLLAHNAGPAPGMASYSVRPHPEVYSAMHLTSQDVQRLILATIEAQTFVEVIATAS